MKRKDQAALSRQKLLIAAQKLITEKGYDETSIADITAACGMSTGNFYHYFDSKCDMFTKLERDPFLHLTEELDTMHGQPVEKQLRHYIFRWIDLSLNQYGFRFNRQWYTHYLNNTSIKDNPVNKLDIMLNEVKLFLDDAVQCGELIPDTPVADLARQIVFDMHGLNLYCIMTEDTFPAGEWADYYCKTFTSNILMPYYTSSTKKDRE